MSETVIDMAGLSAKHTSQESARRVKKRHWAQVRLKAYGIIAICLAGLALAILVWTIVTKAYSVNSEYYLSMDVELVVNERAMATLTDGNPATRVDLVAPLRDGLRDAAETDIKGRSARPLYALLSKFEGFVLSDLVEANPELIGERYRFEALFDDEVQLYFMGDLGELEDAGSTGTISLAPGEDDDQVIITLTTSALNYARQLMQEDREREARALRNIAGDQARAVDDTMAKLEEAETDEERAQLQSMIDAFTRQRDAKRAEADAALIEATDLQNIFQMRTDDPSLFIRANKGWFKIVEFGQERLVGEIVEPPTQLGEVPEGSWSALVFERPEGTRQINDRQLVWLEQFRLQDRVVTHFNWDVLQNTDSSSAEIAGIWGALIGSFWTMMVTFLLVFPVGVMASIYLEEFAPKNRLTNFIEVNINNLAAVPSIVFGLLGLTVLLTGVQLFGVELFDGLLKAIAEDPRSTPLAGGVVLALMSLPTIIIASRASIKAVPPSIRDAALGLGASKLQTSTHHVLPLAMPGIMTGSIIAMAQALGETAPLIIIGMNSFIQETPGDPLDKANVLPSLIYLWNNNSERLFEGKTAVAITVLLVFLILMNALAVILRKRFERRW
ncbi:MAG: phosphate ABC transporter permease PstA [Pseudomonadota bacterium]